MGEVRLYSEVHGERGPHLLLLHGMLASRAQWEPNLPALARVCRPVVVELLGHGRSPSPDDPACYSPAAYVGELERIRQELGAERWFVCGTSLGAAITLRYALDHPERVVGHAFTNSNSALADAAWVEQTRAAMQGFLTLVEARGLEALEQLPVHPRHARRLAPEIKQALVADARLHSPGGVARTAVYTVVESSVRSRVASSRVPMLLLHGTRERRFAEAARHARQSIPGLEVVSLDAGHAVNLEAQAEFDAALAGFVLRFSGAERG